MTRHDAYFDQPEGPASALKHALLSSYLDVFVGKTGKPGRSANGRRVVVVDGYAGPGRHGDGTKGSPLIIADTAARLSATRFLDCVFVEKDRAHAARLEEVLAQYAPGLVQRVLQGEFAEYVDPIVRRAAGVPLFAFLDPFGVPLPHDRLLALLNRNGEGRSAWPPTEVLLNFSADGVRRIGGKLRSGADDEKTFGLLDGAFGGDWWRAEFVAASEGGDASDAADIWPGPISGGQNTSPGAGRGWSPSAVVQPTSRSTTCCTSPGTRTGCGLSARHCRSPSESGATPGR